MLGSNPRLREGAQFSANQLVRQPVKKAITPRKHHWLRQQQRLT